MAAMDVEQQQVNTHTSDSEEEAPALAPREFDSGGLRRRPAVAVGAAALLVAALLCAAGFLSGPNNAVSTADTARSLDLSAYQPPLHDTWWRPLIGGTETRIIMVGLDAAGKTTILYNMAFGEVVTSNTLSWQTETVEFKNIKLISWDTYGQEKIRSLWRSATQCVTGCKMGLIFVVDSSDRSRVEDARKELSKMLSTMKDAPLLVFANKQDVPNAMTRDEVTDKLGLDNVGDRQWFVQSATAITTQNNNKAPQGLFEGLDWLSRTIASK